MSTLTNANAYEITTAQIHEIMRAELANRLHLTVLRYDVYDVHVVAYGVGRDRASADADAIGRKAYLRAIMRTRPRGRAVRVHRHRRAARDRLDGQDPRGRVRRDPRSDTNRVVSTGRIRTGDVIVPVITTDAGLYRYQMRDVVLRVTGTDGGRLRVRPA